MTMPVDRVDPGVPETLRQMLEIQLQHATEPEQQLLKCASVAGLSFTTWAISAILGSDQARHEETCNALAEQQQFLKYSQARDLPGGASTAEYQFRHALYREVLYRRITPTQRVAFHRRYAEALEGLRSPVEPEMAAEIALHFEEGQERERAIPFLLLAAQSATRRYAHRRAIAVLEHARELVPQAGGEPRTRAEMQILEKLGNAYYALGDMKASASAYEAMARRAAEDGVLEAQAEALMRAAHPAEAVPFFLQAVALAPDFVAEYVTL